MHRALPIALALTACRATYQAPDGAIVVFEGAPPRNVLVLSVDTLRRDRVGIVDGSERTPRLDALLGDGVWLEDHRSSSNWTYASVLCALAGADQVDLGFAPMRGGLEVDPVPGHITFLAEVLSGHDSALVSANPLLGEGTGTAAGYDRTCTSCDHTTRGEEVVARGLEELDTLMDGAAPWLLHLHFMDPHLPYAPPEAYLAALADLPAIPYDLTGGHGFDEVQEAWWSLSPRTQAAVLDHAEVLYNAEVAYLDDQLASFLDAADRRGALDDTLVVLWADHGEQFFDHGGIKHGTSLYPEENRVIAGFWARGLPSTTWDEPTTHADLAPTVLAALKIEPPASWTGLPVGLAPAQRPRYATVLSSEAGGTRQSVEVERKRLIYAWDGQLELYDLVDDPTEHHNLYAPGHPDVPALWSLLQPRVGLLGANVDAPAPTIPVLGVP